MGSQVLSTATGVNLESDLETVHRHATSESMVYCAEMAKSQARNFYYGMKLTPDPRRSALYALYVWMRAADDLADDESRDESVESRVARIELFRRQSHDILKAGAVAIPEDVIPAGESGGQVNHALMWPAVQKAFQTYNMPVDYLDGLIDGQVLDQFKKRYQTFEQVHDYCYKVASLVGLCCIQIWGLKNSQMSATDKSRVTELAIKRGLALQLTNIIRDVVEDAQRDRIYIPLDELRQCGFSEASFIQLLLAGKRSFAMEQLLKQQVDRARQYYVESAALENLIASDCKPTCWSIMRIYRGLLDKIEKNPQAVLDRRISLSGLEKIRIGLVALACKR